MQSKRKFLLGVLFLLVGFILALATIIICKEKPDQLLPALGGLAAFMGGMFPGVAAIIYGYSQEYKFNSAHKPVSQ